MADIIENRFTNFVSSIEKNTEIKIVNLSMGTARGDLSETPKDDNWRCGAAAIAAEAVWLLGGKLGQFYAGRVDGDLCELVARINMPSGVAELRVVYKALVVDTDRQFTLADLMQVAAKLYHKLTDADIKVRAKPAKQTTALGITAAYAGGVLGANEEIITNFFKIATSALRIPVGHYVSESDHSTKLISIIDPSVTVIEVERLGEVGVNAMPYGIYMPIWTEDPIFTKPEPKLIPLNVNEIKTTARWQINRDLKEAGEKIAVELAVVFGASEYRLLAAEETTFKYGSAVELIIGMVIDDHNQMFSVVCGNANSGKPRSKPSTGFASLL